MANPKGILAGPIGETIFHSPFFAPFERPNELPQLFQQVEGLHDHRLLALVTALIVEDRLDKLLGIFLPRYEVLTDCNEFTFSMKIRILESLCFIPRNITEACHIIRLIRNDFAHNLERTKFSSIEKKILRKIEGLLRRVDPTLEDKGTGEESILKNFKMASFVAISGIDSYMVNFDKLREKISDGTFVQNIQQELSMAFKDKLEKMKATEVKEVRKAGKQWQLIREGGLVEVVDELPENLKKQYSQ